MSERLSANVRHHYFHIEGPTDIEAMKRAAIRSAEPCIVHVHPEDRPCTALCLTFGVEV